MFIFYILFVLKAIIKFPIFVDFYLQFGKKYPDCVVDTPEVKQEMIKQEPKLSDQSQLSNLIATFNNTGGVLAPGIDS